MNKIKSIAVLSVMFIVTLSMSAQKAKATDEAIKNLKPYPVSVDSLERHVIYLEQKENETSFKVEIIPGKNIEVDCNRHRLLGEFSEETVEGWGYTYFIYDTEEHIASTMMACPDPKKMKFVEGDSELVRYNSRLPIVVYLPKGIDVKYRIWSAGELQTSDQK